MKKGHKKTTFVIETEATQFATEFLTKVLNEAIESLALANLPGVSKLDIKESK